jgi:hypothetical protein
MLDDCREDSVNRREPQAATPQTSRIMVLLLPLLTVIASLATLVSPTFAFHTSAPSSLQIIAPKCHNNCAIGHRRRQTFTTTILQMSSEEEMRNRAALMETRMDPLIASLTRDDSDSTNVPTRQVPLFGELPADGNLALLVPAATIAILGFLLSIVVAFNSRDAIAQSLSSVELSKMEYTPTVVEEGKCRGLCSSQEEDLDGLRNFMESINKKD